MSVNQSYLKALVANLAGFSLLATGSLCAGLVINQFRDQRLPLLYSTKQQRLEEAVAHVANAVASPIPDPQSAIPSGSDNPHMINLEELRGVVDGKKSIIFDARPEIFYRFGHVPGALSLPREDFENGYSKYKTQLESNKGQPIAVYCSSASCEDSDMVATALVKLGYTRVQIFKGGWDAWSGAGLPQEGKQ